MPLGKKINIIIWAIFLLVGFDAYSQSTIVQGNVSSGKNKIPVKAARISLKGSYDGAVTDSLGNYRFKTTKTGLQVVEVDASGYMPQSREVQLNGASLKLDFRIRKEINELEAVTITAGSFEANDEKRMTVLNPLDIVTTAGANADIAATLQTLPGAQRVGESEGLFIRGGSAEESKIIIDGTVVNNFFFSSVPGIAQRGRFSPFLFKNTAFSSGGYSAMYGQALSAVLNLESVDLPDETEAQAGISPIFGSVGFQKVNKEKKYSFGSSYSYSNLWLYMLLIPQKQDFVTPPTSHNVDLNYRKKFKKGMFKAYAYFNTSKLSMRTNSMDSLGLKNSFSLNNSNVFTNVSWKQLFGKNWKLYTVGSYSYDDNKIKGDVLDSQNNRINATGIGVIDANRFGVKSYQNMYQLRSVIQKKWGKLSAVRFGGEMWHNVDRTNFSTEFSSFSGLIDDTYSAAFVESDIFISNKFALRPGLRYEYSQLMSQANLAPRASLSYQLKKNTQLSLDYGIFYQTPDRKYLALGPDVKYSRADHYILTFQHLTKEYTLRSQLFYKSYDGLIKTDPTNQFAINNNGYGYAQGIELFWRDRKTFKGIDYWISYSFLDTKRDYLNFPIYVQPGFAATHTGSVVIKKFWVEKMVGINWSFNWATGRPYYNPNRGEEAYLSDRTPFYSSNNFSFNWLTKIAGGNGVVVVGINNVFNQKQVFGYTYSSRLTDDTGQLIREELGPPARMSFFVGLFISWGVDRTQQNINNNL